MRIIYFAINFVDDSLDKQIYLIQDRFIEFKNEEQIVTLDGLSNIKHLKPKKIININMDAYMYNVFKSALKSNDIRITFIKHLTRKNGLIQFNITVIMPKYQMIDKKGNKLFEISCLERRELDNALAWFSTLGGAFSALGDKIEYCAVMAGKISHQQFRLALRLGDPNLVSRCKLYMALSLIQQKRFLEAKYIIKSEYIIAKQQEENDKRLKSMCLGIWTKWKYDKKQEKLQ